MNTSFAQQNIQEIEQYGYIINCGPTHTLHVVHDDVGKYCKYLNSIANHSSSDEEYEYLHLNEPAGDFTAIFKPDFYQVAKNILDHYADLAAQKEGISRNW